MPDFRSFTIIENQRTEKRNNKFDDKKNKINNSYKLAKDIRSTLIYMLYSNLCINIKYH